MIGGDENLETWQVSEKAYSSLFDITEVSQKEISAKKIQDHRAYYLDYEGPISCDRGHVTAMDKGNCTEILFTENKRIYALLGTVIKGTLTLLKDNMTWLISFIKEK